MIWTGRHDPGLTAEYLKGPMCKTTLRMFHNYVIIYGVVLT